MKRTLLFAQGMLCLLLTLFAASKSFAQTNLILNGTFGTPGAPSNANWTGNSCVPEVNPISSYGGSGNNPVLEIDDLSCAAQDVCVLPGLTYSFNFNASRRNGASATILTRVLIQGLNASNTVVETYNDANISRSNTTFAMTAIPTITFTPASTVRRVRISLTDATGGGQITLGNIIDDVTLTATDPAISGPSNVCVNSAASFSVTGAGTAATYSWDFGANATPATSTLASPSVTWSTIGNRTVQVIIGNGTCNAYAKSQFVVIEPLPTITTSAVAPVCQGASAFTIPYSGTTNGANQYSLTSSNLTGFTPVNNATLPASPISVTIPASAAAGTYNFTLTVRNSTTGCVSANVPVSLTINPLPTITTGTVSPVCLGATSFSIPYTATTNGANQYSLTSSNLTGFTPVTNAALPASPISVTLPAGAAAGTYNFTLTVRNSTTGCVSANVPVSLTINPLPTITTGTVSPVCLGATTFSIPYTATTNSPNQYSLTSSDLTGFTAVSNAALPASPISVALPAGAAAGTYNFTLTVRNSTSGCVSANVPVSLTINPLPTITTGTVSAVCQGAAAFTIPYTSTTNGANQYSITSSNLTGFTAVTNAALPASPISVTLPAGAAAGTYNFTLTVRNSATGCVSANVPVSLTIHPTPTVTPPSNVSYCHAANVPAQALTGTPAGVVYDISGGAAIGLANQTNVTQIPAFTADNTTTSPVTATISITPKANGCSGTTRTFTITVNPTPVLTTTPADAAYCNGATVPALALSGTPSGISYDVAGGSAIGLTNQTGVTQVPSFTASNSGTAAVTATITVTPKANGCTGIAKTYVITVNPTPVVTAPANAAYCNGAAVAAQPLTGTPTGVTYDISGGAAIGLANQTGATQIPAFTATNSGTSPVTATISITPKANGCTGTAQTFTITVNPTPAVTAPANAAYCNGASIPAQSLTGTPTGITYDISGGATIGLADQTGATQIPAFTATNNGTSPATATISIIPKANGCTGTTRTFTITVNPTPAVTAPGNAAYCHGAPVPAQSLTGSPTGVTYDISGGAGIGLANQTGATQIPAFTASNTTTAPITATITLTPKANGCTGTARTFTITVNPTPVLTTTPVNAAYCNNEVVPALSLAGTPLGISYDVTGGTAIGLDNQTNVTQVPSFSATNTGNTPVTVTITVTPKANGCTGAAKTYTITVNPTPAVTAPANAAYCNGASVPAQTLTGSPAGVTYDISGGAAIGLADQTGASQLPAFTATNTGTSPVTTTITITPKANGCTGTPQTFTVTVNPTPVVTAPANAAYCHNTPVSAQSLTGTPAGMTYDITGGASIGLPDQTGVSQIPAFTATNTGTSRITATITITPKANGCTGSAKTFTITVDPVATTAAAGPDQELCNAATTTLAGNTPTAGTGVWSQLPGGPNTAVIADPSSPTSGISGLVPGTYQFTWTITSGVCATSQDVVQILIHPSPGVAAAGGDQIQYNSGVFTMNANAPAAGTGTWTVLPGTGPATITNPNDPKTTVTLDRNKSATLRWTLTNGNCTPSTDDVVLTYTSQADLRVVKSDAGSTYRTGSTVTYTITADNLGPSDVSISAAVHDLIPDELEDISWTVATTGAGVTASPSSGTSQIISVNFIMPFAAGNKIVITVTGKVKSTAVGGTVIENSAVLAFPSEIPDPDQSNNTSDVSGTVPNNPPVAVNDNFNTTRDVAVSGNVRTNDSDPENGALTVNTTPVTAPASGTLVLNGDGTFTYTPNPGFVGADQFVYEVCDPLGACAQATAAINVTAAVNDLEVAKTASASSVAAGGDLTYTVTVTNKGASRILSAEKFTVKDVLPADFTATGFTPSEGTYTSQTGEWTGVDFTVNKTITLTITGKINAGATVNSVINSVTATPPAGATDPSPATADVTTTVSRGGDLSITKSDGATTYTPGTTVTYTITATNAGPSNAVGARIADALPAGITTASWTASVAGGAAVPANSGSGAIDQLVDIPVNGTVTYNYTITVPAAYAAADPARTLTNTATITAPAGFTDANTANNTAQDVNTPDATYGVVLSKTSIPAASANAGEGISFEVEITNSGPSDLVNAAIADNVTNQISNVSWTATVSGGATVSAPSGNGNNIALSGSIPATTGKIVLKISGTVLSSATGSITNTASVTPAGKPEVRSNTVSVPIANKTGINITKTGPPTGHVGAGESIRYIVTVTNAGPSDAMNVVIADQVPGDIELINWTAEANGSASFVSGAPQNGTSGNINTTANIPAGGGNSIVITIDGKVKAAATASLTNKATATPGGGTAVEATNITTVDNKPGISITKSANTTADAGSAIRYQIVVANAGPSDAVNAAIADKIPGEVTVTAWNTVVSGGAVVLPGGTLADNQLDLHANIPAGAAHSVTITIDGIVKSGASGSIKNKATITVPGQPEQTSNETTTTITNRTSLAISKSGVTQAAAGETITYTMVITNAGPSDAYNVTVRDTIPTDILSNSIVPWAVSAVAEGTATVGAPAINGQYVEAVGNIPEGAANRIILTITGKINPAFTGEIRNRATIISPEAIPSNVVATTVTSKPDLKIEKSGPASVAAGAPISYAITVRNEGLSDAINVSIDDIIHEKIGNVSWTTSLIGDATISAGATGAGTNNVKVTGTIPAGTGNAIVVNILARVDSSFVGTISNTASVTPPGGATVTSTPVPTTVTNEPSLRITKSAPAEIEAGNQITYTITVTNDGPSLASGVSIQDKLDNVNLELFDWKAVATGRAAVLTGATGNTDNVVVTGNIPPNDGSIVITVTATVKAGFAGQLNNTATAEVTGKPAVSASAATTIINKADLSFTKSAPATIAAGQLITYTLEVANNGPSTARNVRIEDVVPGNITDVKWKTILDAGSATTVSAGATGTGNNLLVIADMPKGNANKLIIEITGKVNPAFEGELNNTATATAEGQPAKNVGPIKTTVTNDAALDVSKTGPARIPAGSDITYVLRVGNRGPSNAKNVRITDAIPGAFTVKNWTATAYGSASITGPTTGSGSYIEFVADIPFSETNENYIEIRVDARAKPEVVALVENVLTATPAGKPPVTARVETQIYNQPGVSVVKNGPASILAGEQILYTITVANAGPSNANNIQVLDDVPTNDIIVESWTAEASGTAAVTDGASGAANNVVVNGNIPAGDGNNIVITIKGRVNPAFAGNKLTNVARAQATGGPLVTDTVVTSVANQPAVHVVKTGPASARAGDSVLYLIRITNSGPSNAPGISIADNLPAGLTAKWDAAVTGTGTTVSAASGTGNINITGDLPAGTDNAIEITVRGKLDPAYTGGSVANTVTVTPAGQPAETSTATTTTSRQADVQILKSGPANAVAGETISYRITVTNAGPSTATGTLIEDNFAAGLTNIAWTAAASNGATIGGQTAVTGTGNISLTADLPDDGRIVIDVTAKIDPAAVTGPIANNAAATTATGITDPTPGTSEISTHVTRAADLEIVKSGPGKKVAGDEIEYRLVVRNKGLSSVTGAEISDVVPADITNVSYTIDAPAGGAVVTAQTLTGNTLTVTANIPADPAAMISIRIKGRVNPATPPGFITNTATVTPPSDVTETVPASNTGSIRTEITTDVGVLISKSGPDRVNVGDPIEYVIEVINTGLSDANPVRIQDAVPAEVQVTGWTAVGTNGATVTPPTTGASNNIDLQASILGTGTPGSKVTLTITGTVLPTAGGTITNRASATFGGVREDFVVTAVNSSTDLRINKSAPATANAGEKIAYTLLVTNAGPAPVTGATITDNVPATLQNVTWTATGENGAVITAGASGSGSAAAVTANIPAGTGLVKVVIEGTVNPTFSGIITNTANAEPPAGIIDPTPAESTAQTAVSVKTALTVSKAGPLNTEAGRRITYTVRVGNDGPSDATDVNITDALPTPLRLIGWTAAATGQAEITGGETGEAGPVSVVANIPVGEAVTVTITADVDPAFSGAIQNVAYARSPIEARQSNVLETQVTNATALRVQKIGPDKLSAGQQIEYTITVSNSGPSTALNTVIADAIPAGILNPVWSATANGAATLASGNLTGQTGNVAVAATLPAGAGNSVVITINGKIDPATTTDTLRNVATATPQGGVETRSDEMKTAVTKNYGLQLVKAGLKEVAAGNQLTYTISISNTGPSDAPDVLVEDAIPAGLLDARWSAYSSGAAGINGGNLTDRSGNVNFRANIPAGPDNKIEITISGKVDPAFSGVIANQAKATPAGDTTVPSNTFETTVKNQTDVRISKTAPANVAAGAPISYEIVLTNNGPSDAKNIKVTDKLPAEVLGVRWSATAEGTAAVQGGNITGREGDVLFTADIPAGGSNRIVVKISGTVSPAARGRITNVAGFEQPDSLPVTTDPVPSEIVHTPGLFISKAAPDTLAAGTPVVYTITVGNTGPSDAPVISIVDRVPDAIANVTWQINKAGTATFTGPATGTGSDINVPASIPAGNGNTITVVVNGTVKAGFGPGPVMNKAMVMVADTVNVADSVQTHVTSEAAVTVIKHAPDTLIAGQPARYVIEVFNNGPSDAINTVIADQVPTQMLVSAWNVVLRGGAVVASGGTSGTGNSINIGANLPAQSGLTIQVDGRIDPAYEGPLKNIVRFTDRFGVERSDSAISTVVGRPNVTVSKSGPSAARAGDAILYIIKVKNAGPSDVKGLNITDVVPAGITGVKWKVVAAGQAQSNVADGTGNIQLTADIAGGAGNELEIQVSGTVSPDVAPGNITNTATVKNAAGVTLSSSEVTTAISRVSDIRLNKVGPDAANAGDDISYTIFITNNGPSNAPLLQFRDTVAPAVLAPVSWTATATNGALVNNAASASGIGSIVNFAASLPAGDATIVVEIKGAIDPAFSGAIRNRAYLESSTGDKYASNEKETTVGRNADLSITKIAPPTVINTENITYVLEVRNNGKADASGAVVKDAFPAALGNVTAGVAATTGGAANVTTAIANGELAATIGTFPAGGVVRITLKGTVTGTGRIANTASVTPPSGVSDPDPADNTTLPVETTIIPQTQLEVKKELLTAPPYVPGTVMRYRITVGAPGQLGLQPVFVADQLPEKTRISAPVITPPAKGTAVYDAAQHRIDWNIGFMEANATLQLEYQYTLTDTGTIANKVIASITSIPGEVVPGLPDTATVTVFSGYVADLVLTKTVAAPPAAKVSDILTYTIALTNAGPTRATRIAVTDPLPANLDVPRNIVTSAGITQFDAGTRRLTWNIDELALSGNATLKFDIRINSGGDIQNTATAAAAETDPNPSNNMASAPVVTVTGDQIFIPNTITPNGDGKNDRFVILGISRFPGSSLLIYNRWGNMVYQSKDYQNQWDGRELNEGTYFYIFKLNTPQGERVYKGWIELLR